MNKGINKETALAYINKIAPGEHRARRSVMEKFMMVSFIPYIEKRRHKIVDEYTLNFYVNDFFKSWATMEYMSHVHFYIMRKFVRGYFEFLKQHGLISCSLIVEAKMTPARRPSRKTRIKMKISFFRLVRAIYNPKLSLSPKQLARMRQVVRDRPPTISAYEALYQAPFSPFFSAVLRKYSLINFGTLLSYNEFINLLNGRSARMPAGLDNKLFRKIYENSKAGKLGSAKAIAMRLYEDEAKAKRLLGRIAKLPRIRSKDGLAVEADWVC